LRGIHLIKFAVGLTVSPDELREIGRRISDLERLINQREGLTRTDDTLPGRFFEDPLPLEKTQGHRIGKSEVGVTRDS
jgi:aldehyde:ferredoxin oxidoreductase